MTLSELKFISQYVTWESICLHTNGYYTIKLRLLELNTFPSTVTILNVMLI